MIYTEGCLPTRQASQLSLQERKAKRLPCKLCGFAFFKNNKASWVRQPTRGGCYALLTETGEIDRFKHEILQEKWRIFTFHPRVPRSLFQCIGGGLAEIGGEVEGDLR
jgi:hypothetical protein